MTIQKYTRILHKCQKHLCTRMCNNFIHIATLKSLHIFRSSTIHFFFFQYFHFSTSTKVKNHLLWDTCTTTGYSCSYYINVARQRNIFIFHIAINYYLPMGYGPYYSIYLLFFNSFFLVSCAQ